MIVNASDIAKGNAKFSTIADWWLDSYAEQNLKERSIERYHQYTKRTYEALGDMPIKEIRAIHIQLFIDGLQKPGVNSRTGGGLSPKTIRGYLGFISDVIKCAWRLELIEANPCDRVVAPKLHKKAPVIYTEDETSEFLFYIREAPTKYYVFFQLAMFAGLRRGELLGLDWTDIDFDNFVVTVRRNSQYTKRKGLYWDEPKSLAGHRVSNGRVECMDDPYLAEKLSAYMEALDDDDRLFYAASTMKKRAHELGIECHDLRRIAAITYRREKKQEPESTTESADEATKDFLRHARFSTTKRYLYNRKLKIKPPREATSGPRLPAAVVASGLPGDPCPAQEAATASATQPDPPIAPEPSTDPPQTEEATTAPEMPPELPVSSGPPEAPPLSEDPQEEQRPPARHTKPRTLERISEYIKEWEEENVDVIPLTISQQQDVTDAFFTLLESGDFAMRLRDHILLEEILSSGFRNQLEVGESGGYYGPELRREVASILFGCAEDLDDEDYEKYGYLAETDMIKDLASDTSHYGPVVVRFRKSHVKGKVTMTSGDSLPVAFGENVIASPTDHPSIGSIFLPGAVYGLLKDNRLNLKSPQQVAETIPPMDRFGRYIELQYHGQLTADDIESVFIGHPLLNPNPDLIMKLKVKGIRVFKLYETDDGEEEIHEL